MKINVELVSTVLLAMLAMSAPLFMSILLFRVLGKEGSPLDSQKSRREYLIVSLIWFVLLLSPFLGIFFGGKTAMPDRLGTTSIVSAVILVLVLTWVFLILILGSKLWIKLPDFTKAFPLHFLFLVYMSCAGLLLEHFFRKDFEMGRWDDDSSGGAESLAGREEPPDLLPALIQLTERSMDVSCEFVIAVLLGMLAISAPPVLSIVLFRVLVKEGVPLDSQKFHYNHGTLSLIFWPMMFLSGLSGILYGSTAAMPDRLRAASLTCAVILFLVLSWFFLLLVLRSNLWAKRPDFTKAFPRHFFYLFHLLPGSWSVLLLYHFVIRKYVEKVFG